MRKFSNLKEISWTACSPFTVQDFGRSDHKMVKKTWELNQNKERMKIKTGNIFLHQELEGSEKFPKTSLTRRLSWILSQGDKD